MSSHNLLVAWLKDAYAMEHSMARAMERHVAEAVFFPAFQLKLHEHLEETRRHADLVEGCLERHGEKASALRATLADVREAVKGLAAAADGGEVVRNGSHALGTEHLEIAHYRAVLAAAHEVGDRETERVCQVILREEEVMARWLDECLPTLVLETLRGSSLGKVTS